MPCFNKETSIAHSIESALQQDYRKLELIVIDDGSTDDSVKVVRTFSDPRLRLLEQNNTGVCQARNNGLAMAQGDFIAFLDADDTWDIGCLSRLHAALSDHPDVVIAYCGWQNVGLPGTRGKPFIPPDYENDKKIEQLFENCRWPIHACLTRRFAIVEAEGFDIRFKQSEDYLLWLKIAAKYSIVRVPEVLAYYHHNGDSVQATANVLEAAFMHLDTQLAIVEELEDFFRFATTKELKQIAYTELLRRAYDCYWRRDLNPAKRMFWRAIKDGYGSFNEYKYFIASSLLQLYGA
ncbi:glycosyltransferase family 2 protein [Methylomarinum vadi]|uniref:glycosyltransferase family 2 protein n=1 Tax=Methylomarinum vadi TaxID=438855 RepID=UPI001F1B9A92|nr:glycosyltransferase family 2 protein [Methylomarinum vadi]